MLISLGQDTEITAVGIRRANHAKPLYPQKLALTSPTRGGRSRTKATELVMLISLTETRVDGPDFRLLKCGDSLKELRGLSP
jgi:hypothetical protein